MLLARTDHWSLRVCRAVAQQSLRARRSTACEERWFDERSRLWRPW
jgi:hypothetical protein